MRIVIVSADRTLDSGHPQNIGDAFLTDCLSSSLRDEGHTVVIADFGSAARVDSAERRHCVSGVRGLWRLIGGADAVILGGGTLLADDQPERLFAGLPRLCATTAVLTRVRRKRLAVFGVGVDPISRRWARWAISLTLRLGRVWVRDIASAARARELMSGPPGISGDVSLFYMHEQLSGRSGAPSGSMVVALNRREAATLDEPTLAALAERYGHTTFVSMDQGADADWLSLSPAVLAEFDSVERTASWPIVAASIADAEVVVASRMHAMYMALLTDTPMVAVNSSPKVDAFVNEFGVASIDRLDASPVTARAADQQARMNAVMALHTAKKEALRWLSN